ncbi:hypothetical protein [Bradyrhizobium sp. 180]|uniref:hypothetical protein n=1 Tax=Bradyrhizobium sp. 180 TaxID=2782650 RepID=UPI001FF820AC|nr:hypothetical protein [Bradyrhizobium sp. 180]
MPELLDRELELLDQQCPRLGLGFRGQTGRSLGTQHRLQRGHIVGKRIISAHRRPENHKTRSLSEPLILLPIQIPAISRPPADATCVAAYASRCPPAKASGDTHKSHDDVAAGEEVEVVDPRHPLYGRRYRLIWIGKESTTRGACKESFARVHYRFGLTLLLPLGVTNLERNGLPRATPTKLSLDALQNLIAVAEESGGACPSNLERSGAVCRRRSGKRSQKISAKSCGR